MTEFEQALVKEVQRLRAIAKQNTDWAQFRVDIEISGRVHSGEINIEFGVGEGYGAHVKANNLDASLYEFMRRKGFEVSNKPLCISYDGEEVED